MPNLPNKPKHTLIYLYNNTPFSPWHQINLQQYISTYLKLHIFTKIYLNLRWFISIYYKVTSMYINLPQITLIYLILHQFTSVYSMHHKVMAGSCFQSILVMCVFPSSSSLYQSSGLTRWKSQSKQRKRKFWNF